MILPDIKGCRMWVVAKGYAPDEGGMQSYAQGVAEAYVRLGALVTVFTQTSAGPRREQNGRIQLVDIGASNGATVAARLLHAMRRERRLGQPDLVHGTTWRTALLPMLQRLPYIVTFHGREFMYASGLSLHAMRLVARRARGIVAVSGYSARKLATRLGPDTLDPIIAWNGSTAGLSLPPSGKDSASPPLILSLCRLERRKNIIAGLLACASLIRAGRSFRYVIAGRGPEWNNLGAAIAAMNLSGTVELAGYVSEARLADLYRMADIFLHPQIEIDAGRDFEGFGIAIADAMHSGAVPVIGREGGAIELVEDGISGLVVDGRSHEELVAALAELIDDTAKRQDMAVQAARRAGSCFTWDRHVDTILQGLATRTAALGRYGHPAADECAAAR